MKYSVIALMLILSGCTTIYFENGTDISGETLAPEWHHGFAFDLYEASAPVNLEEECDGDDWASVKTEVSFINGLAASAINWLGPIWYPKTTQVTCR